jgi:hypothetical protein
MTPIVASLHMIHAKAAAEVRNEATASATPVVPAPAPERPLQKGDVVKYKDGHCRIKSLFKTHATLCGVFGGRIYAKKVPLTELKEDHDAWYEEWTKSETYRCM